MKINWLTSVEILLNGKAIWRNKNKDGEWVECPPPPGVVQHGYEEGATCNRDGCTGAMLFAPEDCRCHISPPCSSCVDYGLTCPECGWRQGDDE